MIRKAVIVVLTLAAVGTVPAFVVSIEHGFGFLNPAASAVIGRGTLVMGFGTEIADEGWFCEERLATDPLLQLPDALSFAGLSLVAVPLWLVCVLLSAYPTIAFIRGPLRRWRRRRKSLCLKCGYDLTGNESGVCPECGTEVEQP